ncbi:hypothetical protein P7C73_g771, partial [Tremellales sp. Uapishka_1]
MSRWWKPKEHDKSVQSDAHIISRLAADPQDPTHHSRVPMTCCYDECNRQNGEEGWEGVFATRDSPSNSPTNVMKVACKASHLKKALKTDRNKKRWTPAKQTLGSSDWNSFLYTPGDTRTQILRWNNFRYTGTTDGQGDVDTEGWVAGASNQTTLTSAAAAQNQYPASLTQGGYAADWVADGYDDENPPVSAVSGLQDYNDGEPVSPMW